MLRTSPFGGRGGMATSAPAPAGPLSAADIEAFDRDGFVVLRGFFAPEDVATARAGLDILTDERRDAVSAMPCHDC